MQTTPKAACVAAERPSSPEERVLEALMLIGRLMRQRFQDDRLDPSSFWLLKELAAQGAMRVTELATSANLDSSTVSRHVQQLHRQGLIERTPDPDDRRAQRVVLSTDGESQLRAGLARRREVLSHSLQGWEQSDTEAFEHLLARFVGDLQDIAAELEQA